MPLNAYQWPGNVREFVNTVAVAVDNAADEPSLYSHHLPIDIRIAIARNAFRPKPEKQQPALLEPLKKSSAALPLDFDKELPKFRDAREAVVGHLEKTYLTRLAQHCGSDVAEACRLSGLSRARLYELLKKHSVRLK